MVLRFYVLLMSNIVLFFKDECLCTKHTILDGLGQIQTSYT